VSNRTLIYNVCPEPPTIEVKNLSVRCIPKISVTAVSNAFFNTMDFNYNTRCEVCEAVYAKV